MNKKNLSKVKKTKKTYKKLKRRPINTSDIVFVIVVIGLIITFGQLVKKNTPVEDMDQKGIKFLNLYEYPTYLIEQQNCMRPYDVGDGVVTFGPGITYPTKEQGITAINQQLNTNYTLEQDCIRTEDLLLMQKFVLVKYEQVVVRIENQYGVVFNQDQFNGLVLLAYNSPNLFKNDQFIAVITNPDSTYQQYVEAADNYYQQLSGYQTQYGSGWYNRIKDSAEIYYYGDYKFQNNLEG